MTPTIYGVLQHDNTSVGAESTNVLRYGLIMARSWEAAETAAEKHWPKYSRECSQVYVYDLRTMMRLLHQWQTPPDRLDTSLPAVA